jgi:hypothetical protein
MTIKFRGRNTSMLCPAGVKGWVYRGGGKEDIFEVDSMQCRKCEYHKGHTNKPRSGYVECLHPSLGKKQ